MMKAMFKMGLVVSIMISNFAHAQQSSTIKKLKIGDQVPDFVFMNEENMPASQRRLSDFRGKLVILDFWATSCGSCLSAMPKMDSLQRVFKNQLQVVLVTETESISKVKTYLKAFRNQEIKNAIANLPKIYDDVRWGEFFPHKSVPHHVWIDKDGIVVAITNGYDTDAKNINDFLQGKKLELQIKDDFLNTKVNNLFMDNSEVKPVFASAFYNHIPNLTNNQYISDTSKNIFSCRIGSASLISIANLFFHPSSKYKVKVPKYFGYNLDVSQRIIYEGNVISKLYRPKDMSLYNKWKMENMFVYEAKIPLTAIEMLPEIAKEDIANYAMMRYKIGISEQNIERDCYVIKFNNINGLKSKVKTDENAAYLINDSLVKVVNMEFKQIYRALSSLLEQGGQVFGANQDSTNNIASPVLPSGFASITGLPSKPVVFDTEVQSGNFDFEIKGNFRDYQQLVDQLATQGIEITIDKRQVKYLVYKDLRDK